MTEMMKSHVSNEIGLKYWQNLTPSDISFGNQVKSMT